jgi:hypothetical protein
MPADPDAGVDPRFDPVFQRGYDPSKHGGHRPRSAPRHATGPTPVTPIRDEPPADVAEAPVTPRAPDVAAPAPVPPAEADLTLQARNPYRLALLIVSIVSIGAAALMIWYRVGEDVYYGGFSGTNQELLFRSQLIAALPVPLLTGGVLGVTLWLAIGAMAHRGRVDE